MGALSTKKRNDRGANLVEFALLMPLLLLLVLGIVEFGFLLGQYNEVRHGAHEGARLAAVNDPDSGNKTCNSVGLGSEVSVDFQQLGSNEIGQPAEVTVSWPVSSLSGLGFMEIFLPDSLSTTADFRLEQQATWTNSSQDRDPMGTPCP